MSILRVSDQAREDLVEIWSYIAQDNMRAADRMIERLVETYRSLLDTPGKGRLRPELRPTMRSFPLGNYLIFYRVVSDRVEILRILHGARDLKTLFDQVNQESFRQDEESDEAGIN